MILSSFYLVGLFLYARWKDVGASKSLNNMAACLRCNLDLSYRLFYLSTFCDNYWIGAFILTIREEWSRRHHLTPSPRLAKIWTRSASWSLFCAVSSSCPLLAWPTSELTRRSGERGVVCRSLLTYVVACGILNCFIYALLMIERVWQNVSIMSHIMDTFWSV